MTYARDRENLTGPHAGELKLTGWFKPNGSSDPTSFDKSWIKSVTRSGVGSWTITMRDSLPVFRRMLGLEVTAASGCAARVQPGAVSLSAKTIAVKAYNPAGINTASKAVVYTDLTDADGSQDFNFASALPTGAIVLGGSINVTTAFTDGAAGVFTADLGYSGDVDSILDGASLAAIAHVATPAGVKESGYYGAITPRLTMLATVNLNTRTAGALTAYVYYLDPAGDADELDIAAATDNYIWVTLSVKLSSLDDGSEL